MGTYTIAVLAGDGIGPEVIEQAKGVLQAIAARFGHTFHFRYGLVGISAMKAEGTSLSQATIKLCRQCDAILFGTVGGKQYKKDATQPEHALFQLRKEFELFANLRPVRPFAALAEASSIRPELVQGTDLLVVRELTGGLYFGKPSEIRETAQGYEAIDTLIYSEGEVERVARMAFEQARQRRRKVTSVDKANVLSSSRLWRYTVTRVARDYPDVTLEHLLVDACAMHLICRPASFDVIVTENLFGGILTDEASLLAGSLGRLPSASLGPFQTTHGPFGLYEPIHGSAPYIAGQEKANTIAAILSAALLLLYSLNLAVEARAIESAVAHTIEAGYRTEDMYEIGKIVVGTRQMGQQIREVLQNISI